MSRTEPVPFSITRRGTIMEPDLTNPFEVEGVLNPAVARAKDGQLYLFPRLVAKGNYSRIGIARVQFDAEGEPVGVERLGVALEPEEPYEKNPHTGGGVEDPRVTYFAGLDAWFMTYTAFSGNGPRIAMAISQDLLSWKRLGLVQFAPGPIDFNDVDNKDAVLFPELVPGPNGAPALALIHRPRFPGSMLLKLVAGVGLQRHQEDGNPTAAGAALQELGSAVARGKPRLNHESIWISYADPSRLLELGPFHGHRRLVSPRARWERIKVGIGTPPVMTRFGWTMLYHGVGFHRQHSVRYSAGALVLGREWPHRLTYRSSRPILAPGRDERSGIVPDVVFPTGMDQRTDIGQPERFDVYFGAADDRIGVGVMHLPQALSQDRAGFERGEPSGEATAAA